MASPTGQPVPDSGGQSADNSVAHQVATMRRDAVKFFVGGVLLLVILCSVGYLQIPRIDALDPWCYAFGVAVFLIMSLTALGALKNAKRLKGSSS